MSCLLRLPYTVTISQTFLVLMTLTVEMVKYFVEYSSTWVYLEFFSGLHWIIFFSRKNTGKVTFSSHHSRGPSYNKIYHTVLVHLDHSTEGVFMRLSPLQSYYINYLEFFCMGDGSISAHSFIYSIIYIIWTQEFLNILC